MATTADYLNKLITQKNTLADNLVTKGVTATHDETLDTLVPKVLEISGGSVTIDGDLSYKNYQNQMAHLILGFIQNVKNNSGANRCGYNLAADLEKDRLVLYQSVSGYNLTHSYAIDFTHINKIIVKGATRSNTKLLTATAYCKITDEILSELYDDWIVINQSVGTTLSEFSYEIDCTDITGETYIYLSILQVTESSSFTSYLYLDSIEFIYE